MINSNSNEISFGGKFGKDLEILGNPGNQFGVTSIAQTTYWPDTNNPGKFNERTTWMNIKFNANHLKKINQNGGFFKGDEIVVKGYLVQRKFTPNDYPKGYSITEIQVEQILSHTPKALKDLAKQAGFTTGTTSQQQQPVNSDNEYSDQQMAQEYHDQLAGSGFYNLNQQ